MFASALWASERGQSLVSRVEDVVQQGFLPGPSALVLDGNQLQQLTGAHGKALGDLLKALLDRADEDPSGNTPDTLKAWALQLHPR